MGYKCVTPGCRTGYDNGKNKTNKMILKQKSVHLSSSTRTVAQKEENSAFREFLKKIRHRHRIQDDFQGDRQDKTCGRQKKRGELKKKKLKTGVIPSVWPNCVWPDVSLANACFHESTIHGLKYYSKHGFENFSEFTTWLKKWEASNKPGLSKETFTASIQTTEALVHLSAYLLYEKGLDFILLDNVQSDALGRRFLLVSAKLRGELSYISPSNLAI